MTAGNPDPIDICKPRLSRIEDPALNAEAEPHDLDFEETPFTSFFVRNNGDLPDSGPAASGDWRLKVDGQVDRPADFSLTELRERFETVTVTAVLECAGNGRAFLDPPVPGAQWHRGAVGCARWTGIRMADLLADIGLRDEAVYTGHHSPDRQIDRPDLPALSRGLPIAKALAPETLLAFAMNGAPLHALHGGPLRVVAPGYPGSAWQKWLTRLEIRDREHDGEKMTGTDYRLPVEPLQPGDAIDPARFAVMTDLRVKSLITAPAEGFTCTAGRAIEIRGFAWSGAIPVVAVELSSDDGATWSPCRLDAAADFFGWRRFRASVTPSAGTVSVMARARDAAGNVQPLGGGVWNPRGYANNGIHRVTGMAVAG